MPQDRKHAGGQLLSALRLSLALLAAVAAASVSACERKPSKGERAPTDASEATKTQAVDADAEPTGLLFRRRLKNPAAYVPPQCFTKTVGEDGQPKNPCYPCHTRSEPPNFVDDEDLQLLLTLPKADRKNPWTNLLSPPIGRAPPTSDDAILEYVRRSNYFDAEGGIALARALEHPPADWDVSGNGKWEGFSPDVQYRFDDRGFDHAPDGTPTGWRAFAYYPFLGTFFPANGSADDVLIRLDPALRENDGGKFDATVYTVNLAVVEALITRADVPIDPVEEAALGVDLDLDGQLGRARRVAFDNTPDDRARTRMSYVGRARKGPGFPIAPGLFPVNTEFFHTVRYLDVGADGVVTMAPRMKELRYAKKVRTVSYARLKKEALLDARITERSLDGTHHLDWLREQGISNELGWTLQGFIEAADGSLRPQSMEESAYCVGCHGGIGVTADSSFSFSRKLGASAPAHGWFHWSQHGLSGLGEPRRTDGQFEYALYLQEAGAGDELRSNAEIINRFFDGEGKLRPEEVERLHSDIARLLLPSRQRALDLDRAYRAIVLDQSFDLGRDAVLAPSPNVLVDPRLGEKTGIEHAVVAMRLARP